MKKLYIPTLLAILLIQGAYIGVRWFHTGHPPIFGTFEAALSASWMLILFSLLMDRNGRFAWFTIPFALLTLIYGLNFDRTEKPLVISEESWWVWFHALFAWLAYGFYTFSFAGAAVMIYQLPPTQLPPSQLPPSPSLLKEGEQRGRSEGEQRGRSPLVPKLQLGNVDVPEAPASKSFGRSWSFNSNCVPKQSLGTSNTGGFDIDNFTYQTLLWGFLAQTIMFVLGSYYSIRLHGSWWVWDPVEYLFAVSWFLYAIPVHGRLFYNWGQKSIAWLIILGMLGTIILYWSLICFPWSTYHIFDTEFKSHF